jgi:hypothetical protein
MGTSTAAGFAGKLQKMAGGMAPARDAALVRAVLLVEGSIQIAAGRYAGRRITATKARYTTVGGNPAAYIRMASRMGHLLDHDTKAHDFGPTKKEALFFPGAAHPFAGPVHTPGTKGARFFERGLELATPRLPNLFATGIA